MVTPNLNDIMTINDRTDKFLKDMRDTHQKRILASINRLENDIIDSLTRLKTDPNGRLEGVKTNLKQAQSLHKEMINTFAKDYNVEAAKLTKGFDEITDFVGKSFGYLGESTKYTGVDKAALKVLQTSAYEQYAQFGSAAVDKISTQMYESVIAGAPFSELVTATTSILTGHLDKRGRPMSAYAKQFAFDSVMNFNNEANVMKSKQAGMTHYLYTGTIITTSRSFCKRRVNKVYTQKQIESWTYKWDGKAGPAMSYRGGYNCRHNWRGVKPEWLTDEQKADLKSRSKGTEATAPGKSEGYGLAKGASDKEWAKHRASWTTSTSLEDAQKQFREKYKIREFRIDDSIAKTEAAKLAFANQYGEDLAANYKKWPGLAKLTNSQRSLSMTSGSRTLVAKEYDNWYYDGSGGVLGFYQGEYGSTYSSINKQAKPGLTPGQWHAAKGPFAVTHHELGHHLQKGMVFDDKLVWSSLYRGKSKTEIGKAISRYGSTNKDEAFCEAFSMYMSPAYDADKVKKRLGDDMDLFFRRLLR